MPARRRSCDRSLRTWGVGCSCERLPVGPGLRAAFASPAAEPPLRSLARPVRLRFPVSTCSDLHPSPTRRGVCSFGDRTIRGLPWTAAVAASRSNSVRPAQKPGLSLSPDSTRPQRVTATGGRSHRDRAREGPARAPAPSASRPSKRPRLPASSTMARVRPRGVVHGTHGRLPATRTRYSIENERQPSRHTIRDRKSVV